MIEPMAAQRLEEIRRKNAASAAYLRTELGADALADSAYGHAAELLGEVDRLAARVAELELVPRCGARAPSVFDNVTEPLGPCILAHGHAGMHEEARLAGFPHHPGARWTSRNDALAVALSRMRELGSRIASLEAEREQARQIARTLARGFPAAVREYDGEHDLDVLRHAWCDYEGDQLPDWLTADTTAVERH